MIHGVRLTAGFVLTIVAVVVGCENSSEKRDDDRVGSAIVVPGGTFRYLGRIVPGGVVSEKFKIENVSQSLIRLKKDVDTGCGCTFAELSATQIEPGHYAELVMKLTAPVADVTAQRITALVRVEEPRDVPQFLVGFSFDVVLPWSVVPKTLKVTGEPSAVCNGVIALHRGQGTNVNLRSVEAKGLPMSLSCERFVNDSAEVRVRCSMPDKSGVYRGTVSVVTTDEHVPSQTVDVECVVVAPMRAVPETLLFAVEGSTTASTQSVRIVSDHEFHIKDIRCQHAGVLGRTVDVAPPGDPCVEVAIDATMFNRGMNRTNVVICATDNRSGEVQELEVPILIVKDGM